MSSTAAVLPELGQRLGRRLPDLSVHHDGRESRLVEHDLGRRVVDRRRHWIFRNVDAVRCLRVRLRHGLRLHLRLQFSMFICRSSVFSMQYYIFIFWSSLFSLQYSVFYLYWT